MLEKILKLYYVRSVGVAEDTERSISQTLKIFTAENGGSICLRLEGLTLAGLAEVRRGRVGVRVRKCGTRYTIAGAKHATSAE